MSLQIKQYEEQHFAITVPHPLEAIRYRMEQQGLNNTDLANILGYKSRRVTGHFHGPDMYGLLQFAHELPQPVSLQNEEWAPNILLNE